MKEKGFLHTVLGICSGTNIFIKLLEFSFWRLLMHLFALSLLAIAVNIGMRYHPFNVSYEDICSRLNRKFGSINFTASGIRPELHPNSPETIMGETLRIDYLPDREGLSSFAPDDGYRTGIIWLPTCIFSWIKVDGQVVPLLPLLLDSNFAMPQKNEKLFDMYKRINRSLEKMNLLNFAESFSINPQSFRHESQLPFQQFRSNIFLFLPMSLPVLYIIFIIIEISGKFFFEAPLYILIFSIFSFMFGRSNLLALSFRQQFVISMYIGFPGLIIASLYSALRLPYLDFSTIFLLAYLFYSFPVFSRLRQYQLLQKENQPQKTQEDVDS